MASDDDDDDEYEYDEYEEYTTNNNMVLGSIYDSLTAEERRPIPEPNLVDVQGIRRKFSNIL